LSVSYFATDHWQSDEEFIPPEQHRQTKAETFTVESYNSRIAKIGKLVFWTLFGKKKLGASEANVLTGLEKRSNDGEFPDSEFFCEGFIRWSDEDIEFFQFDSEFADSGFERLVVEPEFPEKGFASLLEGVFYGVDFDLAEIDVNEGDAVLRDERSKGFLSGSPIERSQ